MSSTSKLVRHMPMITHSIYTEVFMTDVTKSGVIINKFIVHCHYHTFSELKLFINFFDVLGKCVYKYVCNIIVKFFYKGNWLLRIESVIKTPYVVTNSRWGCVYDTDCCNSCQGLVGMLIAMV